MNKQKYHNNRNEVKSNNYLIILLAILPIIVAIGAYSSESLFIKIFKSKNTYSVVRVTSMGGTVNTGFFRAYPTAFGELLAPIQMLLYLNIRNESEFEQLIEGVLLEIQDKDNTWITIKSLVVGLGIFSALGDKGLKESIQLDFNGQNLIKNLGQDRIKQKDVISGWLFLEFPKKFRSQNVLHKKIRITFFSGFGERESHIITTVDLPEKATQTRGASFKPLSGKRDLSKLEILAEEDLFNRFKK